MNNTLSILSFHRVLYKPAPILPDEMYAERFNRLLKLLKNFFLILPVSEAVCELKKNRGSKMILSITFDDGYKDNYSVALPILIDNNLKATFFVASGFSNGQWMWNEGIIKAISNFKMGHLDLSCFNLGAYDLTTVPKKQKALSLILEKIKYMPVANRIKLTNDLLSLLKISPPADMMMNEKNIKTLHDAGMEIGGHTINHPILSNLPYQDAYQEILGNKNHLENIVKGPVTAFAYPNGKPGVDYTQDTIKAVKKAGYQYAVSTVSQIVTPSSDSFQLPRFTPWDKNPFKFALRLSFKMISAHYFRKT